MELILSNENKISLPKMTMETFEIKNNYYAVTDGEVWNYYPVSVEPFSDDAKIIRFTKSPPVLLEGIVILQKRVFNVTIEDLSRRVIRTSREIIQEKTHARTATTNTITNLSTDTISPAPIIDLGASNQPGLSQEAQLEINKTINAAWDEQIGALLHHIAEKEGSDLEWEIEDNS